MLNVFITVDTEIWPLVKGWPRNALPAGKTDFSPEFDAYIRGHTASGEYGVAYQSKLLQAHGLKAVYFVEPLFAGVAGIAPLAEIVATVQEGGHEVGLHPHTEWLSEIKNPALPQTFGPNMHGYAQHEQAAILQQGLANLREAGARNVVAYRAGGYGASLETLSALAQTGIRFDTSYNFPYPNSFPDMERDSPLRHPRKIGEVWEFPVTFFSDYPGHVRPTQLCACSFQEMRHALLQAWRKRHHSFVIVSHSFELLKRDQLHRGGTTVTPDATVIRRFEKLCHFLAANRDKFRTLGFADIDPASIPDAAPAAPLQSNVFYTGMRQVEQFAGRWL